MDSVCIMVFLTPWILLTCVIRTEGLTLTSVSSGPLINGSSATMKFCSYTLSSAESISAIQWKFAPTGAITFTSIASYNPFVDFTPLGSYAARLTRPDPNSGHLHLSDLTFSDSGNYSCEVVTNLTQDSTISEELIYMLPLGPLLIHPCPGIANETFNCCLAVQGVPPVTITLNHSSGGPNVSSTSNCVEMYVANPGNVTCSVTLPAFPNYTLNISAETCKVNGKTKLSSITHSPQCTHEPSRSYTLVAEGDPLPNITVSGGTATWSEQALNETAVEVSVTVTSDCICQRILVVTANNSVDNDSITLSVTFENSLCALDNTFGIVHTCVLIALLAGIPIYWTWPNNDACRNKDGSLRVGLRDILAIILIILALIFWGLVAAVNLASCWQCNIDEEIALHIGSIILVVVGPIGVGAAMTVFGLSLKKRKGSAPDEPVLNEVYRFGTFVKVHSSWLDVKTDHSGEELFCVHWPPSNQEELAKEGAKPQPNWKLNPVMIMGNIDDLHFVFMNENSTLPQKSISSKVESGDQNAISPVTQAATRLPRPLKKFVLLELITEQRKGVVPLTWLRLKKVAGQNRFYAYWPQRDQEKKAKECAEPSKGWVLHPVVIMGSADVFPGGGSNSPSPHSDGENAHGKNSTGGTAWKMSDAENPSQGSSAPSIHLTTINTKGDVNSDPVPSPNRRLPPLDAGNEQTDSERKKRKKKSKKDPTESQERRPLPALNQVAPETQRRPSMDAHINMSVSNTTSLPMRNAFTPGQQASG